MTTPSIQLLPYTDLLEAVRPYIVQVDEAFAIDRLCDAVIEFCRESNLITEQVKVARQDYTEPGNATASTDTVTHATDADLAQGESNNTEQAYQGDTGSATSRAGTYVYKINPGGFQADRILDARVYRYGGWERLLQGFYANQVVGGDSREVHVIVTNRDAPAEVWFTYVKVPLRATGPEAGFPRYIYDVYKEALLAKIGVVLGNEFMRQDRDWNDYYNRQLAKILESMATRDSEPLGLITGEPRWGDSNWARGW